MKQFVFFMFFVETFEYIKKSYVKDVRDIAVVKNLGNHMFASLEVDLATEGM